MQFKSKQNKTYENIQDKLYKICSDDSRQREIDEYWQLLLT